MRPASWSYQLLDAGAAHPKGADSLLRGQRDIFGERPLHALLATMEYRMLAIPGGTSSQVAGHSQQRPTVSHLAQSALQGDWNPLVGESRKASGKHWAEDAKCDGQDTEIFFPTGDGPQEDPVETAKRLRLALVKPLNLCASCPLATAARCLVESLRDNEEFGIRGGLLASERSALRTSWQQRVNESAVRRALQGSTATLSKAERDEVVARFAEDLSMDPGAVARGLGVTHDYLLKLARTHRQKHRPEQAAPMPMHSTDAA